MSGVSISGSRSLRVRVPLTVAANFFSTVFGFKVSKASCPASEVVAASDEPELRRFSRNSHLPLNERLTRFTIPLQTLQWGSYREGYTPISKEHVKQLSSRLDNFLLEYDGSLKSVVGPHELRALLKVPPTETITKFLSQFSEQWADWDINCAHLYNRNPNKKSTPLHYAARLVKRVPAPSIYDMKVLLPEAARQWRRSRFVARGVPEKPVCKVNETNTAAYGKLIKILLLTKTNCFNRKNKIAQRLLAKDSHGVRPLDLIKKYFYFRKACNQVTDMRKLFTTELALKNNPTEVSIAMLELLPQPNETARQARKRRAAMDIILKKYSKEIIQVLSRVHGLLLMEPTPTKLAFLKANHEEIAGSSADIYIDHYTCSPLHILMSGPLPDTLNSKVACEFAEQLIKARTSSDRPSWRVVNDLDALWRTPLQISKTIMPKTKVRNAVEAVLERLGKEESTTADKK